MCIPRKKSVRPSPTHPNMSFFIVVVVVTVNRKSAYNPDISTMLYGITVILVGMKALVVTELQHSKNRIVILTTNLSRLLQMSEPI